MSETTTQEREDVHLNGEGSALDAVALMLAQLRRVAILSMGTAEVISHHSRLVSAVCQVLSHISGPQAIDVIKEFSWTPVTFNIRWTDHLPANVVPDESLEGISLECVLLDAACRLDEKRNEATSKEADELYIELDTDDFMEVEELA